MFSVAPLSATQYSSPCLSRGAPRAAKAERALVATRNPAPRLVRTLPKNPPCWELGLAGAVAESERFGHSEALWGSRQQVVVGGSGLIAGFGIRATFFCLPPPLL